MSCAQTSIGDNRDTHQYSAQKKTKFLSMQSMFTLAEAYLGIQYPGTIIVTIALPRELVLVRGRAS